MAEVELSTRTSSLPRSTSSTRCTSDVYQVHKRRLAHAAVAGAQRANLPSAGGGHNGFELADMPDVVTRPDRPTPGDGDRPGFAVIGVTAEGCTSAGDPHFLWSRDSADPASMHPASAEVARL